MHDLFGRCLRVVFKIALEYNPRHKSERSLPETPVSSSAMAQPKPKTVIGGGGGRGGMLSGVRLQVSLCRWVAKVDNP